MWMSCVRVLLQQGRCTNSVIKHCQREFRVSRTEFSLNFHSKVNYSVLNNGERNSSYAQHLLLTQRGCSQNVQSKTVQKEDADGREKSETLKTNQTERKIKPMENCVLWLENKVEKAQKSNTRVELLKSIFGGKPEDAFKGEEKTVRIHDYSPTTNVILTAIHIAIPIYFFVLLIFGGKYVIETYLAVINFSKLKDGLQKIGQANPEADESFFAQTDKNK